MQHSWGAEAALCPAGVKHLPPATSPQGLLLNQLLAPKPVPPVSPLVSGTGPQAQEGGVVLRTRNPGVGLGQQAGCWISVMTRAA